MDADGLPLVGPGIDYTKVDAINQKRLIAFINHFVTHTAGFLNRFSCVCEEKLEHLSHRIQQLDITMSLLEAKINSIPGLENVTAPLSSSSSSSSSTAPAAPTEGAGPVAPPTVAAPAVPAAPAPGSQEAPPPPPAEPVAANPVSKDPRYQKFFKMLQFGVPVPAIKTKMSVEGLNPDLLDTPDAPAPAGGTTKANDDDDFSSNSEDEESEEDDSDFD
ncbi:WASH complex subunit 3-like [Dreissena polymorpha]|uniref:WASH complex subunit 3 n=1 Tax=Dreissena polymorpha TaxID=45954 RepID=A0A9D4D654_DREPO|nr:WASH complex subunit 3-like [Dreissena polymorpha]KAH3738664.1 hypothetical protein DPMN_045303 [Dreissena polymorpha]